jgi:hypothetical protein
LVTSSPTEIWGGAAAPALPGFGQDAQPRIPAMNGGTVRMRPSLRRSAEMQLAPPELMAYKAIRPAME